MENENLQNQIDELKRRLDARDKQQISYPLDIQSINVLQKYFMRIIDTVFTTAGAAGHVFTSYIGRQDEKEFEVSANTFIPYTVNVSSNYLTVSKIYFNDGDHVYVSTSDTPPSPLTTVGDYYIINSTGTTFQLSLTAGGAAIDITDAGTGKQYIYFF